MKRIGPILVCLGLGLSPAPARADLAGHFGMNSRTMGLGGAYTGVAEDLASLYYNPAGLVQLPGMTFSAGFLFGTPQFSDGDTRIEMPEEISYYLHAGLPLSGALEGILAFGVSINMPWGQMLTTQLYKKHEPYFVLYDSSIKLFQLRLGAAGRIPYEPLSFLSFGVSLRVLGTVYGQIGFYAPIEPGGGTEGPVDPDARLEAWGNIKVPTNTSVTAGVMARLGKRWRVGLTYHSKQSITIELPLSLNTRLAPSPDLRINIPVDTVARLTTKYHPQQMSFGVSYRRDRLLLALDLVWIDYSSYEVPYVDLELDLDKLRQDPGLRLLLGPKSQMLDPFQPMMEWVDVVVPRLGAEYRLLSWLTLRGGYFYEVSPLRSTDFPIFDCDKHGFALSGRASFLRPLGLLPGWLHLDLSLQELVYVGRSVLGEDVGGHVFSLSTGVEVSFQ